MPASLKRKRPPGHDNPSRAAPTRRTTAAGSAAQAPGRRATRQSSIAPLPVLPDPEPRRRRRDADANGQQRATSQTLPHPRGKENIPVPRPGQNLPMKPLRVTRRHSGAGHDSAPAPAPPRPTTTAVPIPIIPTISSAPSAPLAPSGASDRPRMAVITPILPPALPPFAQARSGRPVSQQQPNGTIPAAVPRRPGRPPAQSPIVTHQQPVGRSKPIMLAKSTDDRTPQPPTSVTQPNGTPGRPAMQVDRNIDKVVLGNICFRAWYPSYYGKEVLGEASGPGSKNGTEAITNGSNSGSEDAMGFNSHTRRDRENNSPVLERLYVCPCCFKYSRELVTWWEHVGVCECRAFIPGRKIYVHPKGKRTILVPSGGAGKSARGKRNSSGQQKMVEEVVEDQGEWSVWEVDGAKDGLFCQNLSLFAKLFLDNKSVFFDVTGFNYFLLVYTPPTPPAAQPTALHIDMADVAEVPPPPTAPRPQIVGFFSKEKMSWDNNNLACILVFPPWQRKGLGALLMGVSYEISRREGILGGPEKPISDLGKKGYKRFWAGEVARWLLSVDRDAVTTSASDETPALTNGDAARERKEDKAKSENEEMVVDVEECSQATWIAPEDCLLVLREMGVARAAGKGPPRPRSTLEDKMLVEENGEVEIEEVQRVSVSKRAVREWVKANRISLERACDPNGFVEGYAIKVESEEEAI